MMGRRVDGTVHMVSESLLCQCFVFNTLSSVFGLREDRGLARVAGKCVWSSFCFRRTVWIMYISQHQVPCGEHKAREDISLALC